MRHVLHWLLNAAIGLAARVPRWLDTVYDRTPALVAQAQARVAGRLLVRNAPRVPLRQRLNAWAVTHAPQSAYNEYETALTQYHVLTGRSAPIPIEIARGGGQQGITPQMLAAMPASMLAGMDSRDIQAFRGIPQPERESADFPMLTGLGHGRHLGLRRLHKPAPFNIRRFSETPPGRRAINKIKGDILRLDWEIVPKNERFRKVPGKQSERIPIDMQGRIEACTRAIQQPNAEETYHVWMSRLVEDILVGGFGCTETRIWDGNEVQPFRMWSVDGMSVRINMDWVSDDHPQKERRFRYSQALAFGGTVVQTHSRVELLDSELMYVRYDPRSHTPFGTGPLEYAYQMINAWIGHFDGREKMESNDIPPFIIQLGKNMRPDDVYRFRDYWEREIEGRGKIPIIGGQEDPEAIMLRMRQMGTAVNAWPEMVLRMIAICFGLAPQTFGIEKDVNRNTSEVMQSEEFSDSVLPVTQALEDSITQHLLGKLCGIDDLKFNFIISEGDATQAAATAVQLYAGDICKLNEAREKADLEPLPADDPRGNMFLSEARAAVQASMAPPAPPPGVGGDPMQRILDESGGRPDAAHPPTDQATPETPDQQAATPNGSDPDAIGMGLPVIDAPNARAGKLEADVVIPELLGGADDTRRAIDALYALADVTQRPPPDDAETFDRVARALSTHQNGHA